MAPDSAQPLIHFNGIQSDKGFLEALGLSESEAANVLGRSRQSLSQARLSSRTNYFKTADITSLVFQARARRPGIDLTKAMDYISQSRGADIVEGIKNVGQDVTDDALLMVYEELWVVIPDFAFLDRKHADIVKLYERLCARDGGITRFFTANSLDKKLLEQRLKPVSHHDLTIAVEPWMGGIPYLIIGDPDGRADSYIFTAGRYMLHEWYGGAKLALLIKSCFKSPNAYLGEPALEAEEGNTRLISRSGR